jgi:hypothetical protein
VTPDELIEVLKRYQRESNQSERTLASRIGVNHHTAMPAYLWFFGIDWFQIALFSMSPMPWWTPPPDVSVYQSHTRQRRRRDQLGLKLDL